MIDTLLYWWLWHKWDKDSRRRLMNQIIAKDWPGHHLHRDPSKKKGGNNE